MTLNPDEIAIARQLAREDYYFFTRWMFLKRTGQHWQRARHHPRIAAALGRVYRGECSRLLLHLPPRYSKTEMAVRNFIAWCFGKQPDCEFLHLSYSAPLAVGNSWAIRAMVEDPEYRAVFPEVEVTGGKEEWRTSKGGIMYAAGWDGTITGKGAGKMRAADDNRFGGAIVIDDPHKAGEALSEKIIANVRDGYDTTVKSRVNDKRTPIIVVMQRLAEHDLAGWLADGGSGEEWEIVSIPVWEQIEQPDGTFVDGEPIWPEKHDADTLRAMEAANPYVFAGQYRQRPAPPAGGNIQPDKMVTIDALPAGTWRWVRGWDLAASKTLGAAYTAGVLMGRHFETGRTVVADVVRLRGGPHEVRQLIKATAAKDGAACLQSLPQDPGQAGKVQVEDLGTLLNGHLVKFSPESGDKIARADPFASQVNIGNVDILRGPWNNAYTNELRLFPNGKFKDQVDASSRAFSEMDNSMERFMALAGR